MMNDDGVPSLGEETFVPAVSIRPFHMSPEIDKLASALAKAQGVMQHPKKNKTAVVPMKAGGSYSYDYSDLADVLDSLREPFAANGLVIVQIPYVDRMSFELTCIGVATLIMHDSGQWLEGRLAMPVDEPRPQAIGSVITYLRRYMAAPMGGVTSEADDDGSAAQGNRAQTQTRQPPPPRQPGPAKTAPPPPREPSPKKEPTIVLFDGETPALKSELYAIAKRLGITKVEDLKKLNNACRGMDMVNLEAAATEWFTDNMPQLKIPF